MKAGRFIKRGHYAVSLQEEDIFRTPKRFASLEEAVLISRKALRSPRNWKYSSVRIRFDSADYVISRREAVLMDRKDPLLLTSLN